jgi:protein-L-isoaspartate(D-aspartate) O-methyltransferase
MDLATRRRFYSEEIEAVANIRTPALVEALAEVPRERFLRPGPWEIRSDMDLGGAARTTPDADPARAYHNYAIAIDPSRQLFNGAPSLLAAIIDALALTAGARALHVGAGLGYYSALIGRVVGSAGTLVAMEIDEALAADARAHLADMPWVDVRCADGTTLGGDTFDAIFVNAGVTHLQETWLDALAPGGRLIAPFTASMPQMGPIGKGMMVKLTRGSGDQFDARVVAPVAIYSAIGLRDDAANAQLGRALQRSMFPTLTRFRRDPHDEGPGCWLHRPRACLSNS